METQENAGAEAGEQKSNEGSGTPTPNDVAKQSAPNDGAKQSAPDDGGWKAPASQAELDQIIQERVARAKESAARQAEEKFADYNVFKAKAEEYDAVKQANEALKRESLDKSKSIIAQSKGLPAEFASRLVGATEDELSADAERMAEMFKASGASPRKSPNESALFGGGDPTRDHIPDTQKIVNAIPRW